MLGFWGAALGNARTVRRRRRFLGRPSLLPPLHDRSDLRLPLLVRVLPVDGRHNQPWPDPLTPGKSAGERRCLSHERQWKHRPGGIALPVATTGS